MSEFNISQNDFSRGLVSKKLAGRSDLKDYKSSLEVFDNLQAIASGGATKRPGFKYVSTLTDRSVGSLGDLLSGGLIPFMPDDQDSYYINLPVVALSPNQSVGARSILINKVDGTVCTVTLTTGSAPYDFQASWPALLDPYGWRYVQSNDIIFICHNSGRVKPFYIIRTGATAFTVALYNVNPLGIVGFSEENTYPYQDINVSSTTLAYSASTITALSATFNASHVGSYVKIYNSATTSYCYYLISTYISPTSVSVVPINDFAAVSSTTNWALSSWSGYLGYPTVVSIFNERIIWGATKARYSALSEPGVLWCSRVGNFFRLEDANKSLFPTYYTTASSLDALKFRIGGSNNNFITWINSANSLQVGSSNQEYVIDFNVTEDGSKTIPSVRTQTSHGGAQIQTVSAGYSTLYVHKNLKGIRRFKYNRENGSYISGDLNTLADDLFKTLAVSGSVLLPAEIKKIVWQESRKTLWVLDRSLTVKTLCFDEETDSLSWSIIKPNDALYIADLVSLYDKETKEDVIIAVADLLNTSSRVSVVMKLGNYYEAGDLDDYTDVAYRRPYFTDNAIRVVAGSPTTTFTGFSSMEGLTVSVLADGNVHSNVVVVSGNITLDYNATEVIVGLPYTVKLQTLPVEAGGMFGDSVGTVKRIDEISIRFYRSYAAVFGDRIMAEENSLEAIEFDASKGLFSGLKSVKFANGYSEDYDAYIVVEQNSPTPLTISCITYRGISYK